VRGIDGALRKIVIGVIGTVSLQDGAMPGWRGESIFTPRNNGRSVLSVTRLESCSTVVAEKELKNFDPSVMSSKKKDESAKGPKTPTPKPAPEQIEPVDE
jgi:hypothetical protein